MINPVKEFQQIRTLLSGRTGNLQDRNILIVVGSAHKVGSTWIRNLIKDSWDLKILELSDELLDRNKDILPVDIHLEDILLEYGVPAGQYIFKSHAYPLTYSNYSSLSNPVFFVTIIRDPRDIVVSASFYLAKLPEFKGGLGKEFSDLNIKKRIIKLLKEGSSTLELLNRWFECDYAFKIRYEKLLENGHPELEKLYENMGLEYSRRKIKKIFKENEFKNFKRKSDKSYLIPRKGIAGDWKNYFDDELKQIFKEECNGEWNRTLIKMNYENSSSW